MKKLCLLTVLLFAVSLLAQQEGKMGKGAASLEKIKQWERLKIIEVLDLDEDTAVKFFARRNEHEQKVRNNIEERNKVIKEISQAIRKGIKFTDEESLDKLEILQNSEVSIIKMRETFINSLSDILTPQQILRLMLFEHHFRNEIRQKLIEKRRAE